MSVTGDANSTPLCLKLRHRLLDVLAHQVQLVALLGAGPAARRMHPKLCRRQGEDKPAIAVVNMRPFELVPQEGPDVIGRVGKDQCVNPCNHPSVLLNNRPRLAALPPRPDSG